ncbi:transcription regulator protein BACH1b [Xenentodon cancila]
MTESSSVFSLEPRLKQSLLCKKSLMAMLAQRSSVFTFESVMHSSHVLRCLDEQRCRDALCDITVVVEGHGFRAHRSVLASCSEYFAQRISSLAQHRAVISLPQEVTVVGFEALLKFAYTSKLHFDKDNILDIQNAASILGFRDLDEACFDFILPKFSASMRYAPSVRKTCCESKCRRRLSKENCDKESDKEVKPVAESSPQQEVAWDCHKSVNSNTINQTAGDALAPVVEGTNDQFMQCPKYRKFQLACGKETCTAEKSLSQTVTSGIRDNGGLACFSCPSSADSEKETVVEAKTGNFDRTGICDENVRENKMTKMEINMEHVSGISFLDISSVKTVSLKPSTAFAERSSQSLQDPLPVRVLDGDPEIIRSLQHETFNMVMKECKKAGDLSAVESGSLHQGEVEGKAKDITCQDGAKEEQAGSMKEEVASQLGPDEGPSYLSIKDPEGGRSTDAGIGCVPNPCLEWHKIHQNFNFTRASCPFFKDVDCPWKPAGISESEGASQSGVSSLNSGEDGDSETETEGDSESSTRERAREVQLPFPVDWIVTLSRNDFQSLLKQHAFTQEQLDFVHDMRRRSKNRLAAQRCRKRKLDCIYNLQCEINKLKTEREKLMIERSQLGQLKLKTCHSVTTLCQRVCSEANLQPEQLQVLAKYTSSDCPLSSFLPHVDALLSQQRLPFHPQASLLERTGDLDKCVASEDDTSGSSRDKVTGHHSL